MKIILFLFLIALPLAAEPILYENIVPGIPTGPGKRLGGIWSRYDKEPPLTPAQIKALADAESYRIQLETQRKLAAKGQKYLSIGISLLLAGALATFILKSYSLQGIGIAIFIGGIYATSKGIIHIKLAENWKVYSTALLVLAVFGTAAIMLRKSGLQLWKKKIKSP